MKKKVELAKTEKPKAEGSKMKAKVEDAKKKYKRYYA